jgi:hypothetical protein
MTSQEVHMLLVLVGDMAAALVLAVAVVATGACHRGRKRRHGTGMLAAVGQLD